MRFLTRHTSRRKISTETICLVALLRRGLLRAPFSVAVLLPCELIREDVSPLGKRSFRECSTMPFLLRRDFRVLYARFLHTATSLLHSLNPFYSRFILLSVPHLSTTTYSRRRSLRKRQLSREGKCFRNLNRERVDVAKNVV